MAISPGINNESQEQLQGSSDTEAQANAATTLLEAAPDGEGSEADDPNLTTGPAEAEQQPATTPLTNESTQETSAPIPPATQAIPPAPTPADMTQFITAMMSHMQRAEERAAQALQLQLQQANERAEQAMQLQKQQAEESNRKMLEMFSQLMTQNKQTPTPSQTHLNPGQTSDEEGSDNETESSTVSHLPQASHHPNITRRGQDRAPSDSSSMLMENHTPSPEEYQQLHPISKTTAFTYYNQNHKPLPNPCDPGTFNRWMHAYDRYKESCEALGHPILPPHHAMGSEGQIAFKGLLDAYAAQMGKRAWADAPTTITAEQCYAFQTYWQQNALSNSFIDVQQQITTAFRQHFGSIPVNVSQPLLQLQATLTKTAIHYGFRHHSELFNTLQSDPADSRSIAKKCLSQMHPGIQKKIRNVFKDATHPWRQARPESAPHHLTTHDILVILRHYIKEDYCCPFGIPSTTWHTPPRHAVTTPKPPKKSPIFTGPQSGSTCPACHDNHDFLTWNSRTKRLNRNCSQKLSDTDFQTYKQEFLAANPGTAKLHKAAVEQHKNRLAKAKATSAKPSSSARRHIATSARSPQILTQTKDLEQLLKTPPARVYSNAQPTVPLSQKKSCIIDTCIFDSGATHSFLPPRLLAQIEKSIGPIETTPLCPSDPSTVHTGQGSSQIVKKVKLHIDLLLHLTQYGTLLHVTFYVPDNSYIGNELLLGETLLTQLGIPPAAAILRKTLAGTVFDQDTQSFHNRTDYDTSTATLTSSMKVLPTAQARRHLAKAVLSTSDLPSDDPAPTVAKSSPKNPIDDYTPTPAQALQGLRNLDFNQGDSEILPDTFFEDIETNHDKHTADCHAELDQRIQEAIANGLDPALRNRLHIMVHDKYFSIFATSYRPNMKPWDVTPWTEPTYPLETVPTISKPASRRYTPAQLEFLEEHMAQLVAANRVRLWDNKIRHPDKLIGFAPAMLVPKPNGSFRVVWDFRQTNRFLQTIQLAPLRPLDVIHNIMNDRPSVYASLDAVSAFYQLSLAPESIQLFLLVTPNAIYECLHQPMGTVNSSQSFSLKMKECFGDLIDSHDLFNYIDDMLCAAQDDEALLDKLERIFQRCADRHFYLNANKVCLYARSIKFLGRILTSDGSVIPDPSRLDFIRTLDTPKTAGDLSSFLGTCSFLADHVPDLPRIIDPLRTLCTTALASSKKKTKRAGQKIQLQTRWTDEHTQAYTQAKQALLDSVPLHWPQPEDEINLFVDASDKGFGAVFAAVAPEEMLKPPRERSLKPLAFFDSRWTATESRWATARQELIALIRSIRAHPEFLRPARSLIAYSDHLNISKVAARITDPNAKDLSVSIMTRASILPASLPIHICHIAGEDNIAADFLSRHATHVHKPNAFARVARSALAGLDAGDDLGFSMDNYDDSDRIDYTIGNNTYAYGRGFGPADVSSANIRTSTRTRRTRNFFTPGLPNPSSSPNVPSPPPPYQSTLALRHQPPRYRILKKLLKMKPNLKIPQNTNLRTSMLFSATKPRKTPVQSNPSPSMMLVQHPLHMVISCFPTPKQSELHNKQLYSHLLTTRMKIKSPAKMELPQLTAFLQLLKIPSST